MTAISVVAMEIKLDSENKKEARKSVGATMRWKVLTQADRVSRRMNQDQYLTSNRITKPASQPASKEKEEVASGAVSQNNAKLNLTGEYYLGGRKEGINQKGASTRSCQLLLKKICCHSVLLDSVSLLLVACQIGLL
eukprot:5599307-Amphidinium_carterae.1